MACYYPLDGWRSRTVNASGKRSIVFELKYGFLDMPVTVPCGRCVGCKLEKSRQWAMRCMHEASLYEENCFVSLTYDEEHLPPGGSLDKSAFQKFMKRLRKKYDSQRIRFYHAGEYGDTFGRPHYHCILFGFDFSDKVGVGVRNGFPVWRSASLEALWSFGISEIGSVTFESAAYVARYITKKITGDKADEYYGGRQPEYATMSRGGRGKGSGGIGKEWFEKFKCEVYAADSVIVRGKEVKPPRFYDGCFELNDPEQMRAVKRARKMARNPDEERGARLLARKMVVEANLELKAKGKL